MNAAKAVVNGLDREDDSGGLLRAVAKFNPNTAVKRYDKDGKVSTGLRLAKGNQKQND